MHAILQRLITTAGCLLLCLGFAAQAQTTTTVEYIHTDALGSPVAVTNEAGQVIERTQWEPYGSAIGKPAYDGPGYTGHVMDGATGLTYMQQRYYDPGIGRFLSVDPVTAHSGTGANFNRYWYANNNPYKFTDPDGRQSHMACATQPALAAACIEAGIATGTGNAGATGASKGGAGIIAGILTGLGIIKSESAESASQDAIDVIMEGTAPAEGQAGKDGVRVGEGGAAGADAAIDTARAVEGAKVLVDNGKTTVVQLPDGRKVESHTSTRGGQYEGDRTVKIQDADGKVRPENIIRYPEPKEK